MLTATPTIQALPTEIHSPQSIHQSLHPQSPRDTKEINRPFWETIVKFEVSTGIIFNKMSRSTRRHIISSGTLSGCAHPSSSDRSLTGIGCLCWFLLCMCGFCFVFAAQGDCLLSKSVFESFRGCIVEVTWQSSWRWKHMHHICKSQQWRKIINSNVPRVWRRIWRCWITWLSMIWTFRIYWSLIWLAWDWTLEKASGLIIIDFSLGIEEETTWRSWLTALENTNPDKVRRLNSTLDVTMIVEEKGNSMSHRETCGNTKRVLGTIASPAVVVGYPASDFQYSVQHFPNGGFWDPSTQVYAQEDQLPYCHGDRMSSQWTQWNGDDTQTGFAVHSGVTWEDVGSSSIGQLDEGTSVDLQMI